MTASVSGRLAYVGPDQHIHVRNLSDASSRCLSKEIPARSSAAAVFAWPTWSPDGRCVAFVQESGQAEEPGIYLAEADGPTIAIVQDLDDGQAGFGSFWGEVNSNIHKSLGCLGTVTNGSVRDIDMLAEDFQVVAGVIAPSHGFIHPVDYDCTVSIAGMVAESHDLIHADRHGAVVIPRGTARAVIATAALIARREGVILDAVRTAVTN